MFILIRPYFFAHYLARQPPYTATYLIDLLITIQKWLERQDRPGSTDDQPPCRHLIRSTDRLFSTETGAGLCIPRALIGPPLVRLR